MQQTKSSRVQSSWSTLWCCQQLTYHVVVWCRVPGFSDSDEAIAIEELLDAVEKGDPDALSQAVSKPVFTYQDNEVCWYV